MIIPYYHKTDHCKNRLEIDIMAFISQVRLISSQRNEKKLIGFVSHKEKQYFFKYEKTGQISSQWLRSSMARRAFNYYELFNRTTMQVPLHRYYWEKRRFYFPLEWFILTDFIHESRPIYDFIVKDGDSENIDKVFYEVGRQLGIMHNLGFSYNAIDETNILIDNRNNASGVWFIDFEHCRKIRHSMQKIHSDIFDALMLFGGIIDLAASENIDPFISGYRHGNAHAPPTSFFYTLCKKSRMEFAKKWGLQSGCLLGKTIKERLLNMKPGKKRSFQPVQFPEFSISLLVYS